jgi:hypothetical protein
MPQQCEAFTAKFHPCRAYADADGTCSKHKYWFQNRKWFYFLVPKIDTFMPANHLLWARRLLRNPKAEATPEFLEEYMMILWKMQIPSMQTRLLLLYDIMCETDRITPVNIPRIWWNHIYSYICLLSDLHNMGMEQEEFKFRVEKYIMHLYFRGDTPWKTYMTFFTMTSSIFHASEEISEAAIYRITDIVMDTLPMSFFAYYDVSEPFNAAKNVITKSLKGNHERSERYIEYVKKGISERGAVHRSTHAESMLPMKWELIEAALHPDRIEPLIKEYGIGITQAL